MDNWLDFVGMTAQLGAAGQDAAASGAGAGGESLGGGGGGGSPTTTSGSWTFPIFVFGMMILMFLMMARSGRKQRRQRADMLSALGRNDKIQTSGGVIGTIVEIKDREVVLRVDEQSNTRIRFARSAVAHVLRSAGGGEEEKLPVEVGVDGRPTP